MLLSYEWDGWLDGYGWKSLCGATKRASLCDANMKLVSEGSTKKYGKNSSKKDKDKDSTSSEAPNLSGWNCPCFAPCDKMAEGSNLKMKCEKDCSKTCKY